MSRKIEDTQSIEGAWRVVGDLYCEAVGPAVVKPDKIEDELLFCLLGGFGITYEHGQSASSTVRQLRPFSGDWENEDLFEEIVAILTCRQFEPRRRDGSFRRYRFPKRKASAIVKARHWALCHAPLYDRLHQLPGPRDRRRFLSQCPGLGFKTASWLLRNLGLGSELAIIDVHVLRALVMAKRIPNDVRIPRDYEIAEEAFLAWCDELDAPSAAFDLFVWHWQRGTLLSR